MNSKTVLRLLGVTVMACVSLGASAGSAQASPWTIGGSVLAEGVEHSATCTAAEKIVTIGGLEVSVAIPLVLTGTVGTTPVKIEFSEVECLGWVIFNKAGVAYSKGKLKLRDGGVVEPTGCTLKTFTTETESITGQVKAYAGLGTHIGITYSPVTVGGNLATIQIQGTCAAAGNRVLKGFTVAEIPSVAIENGESYEYEVSSAIETATGSELKFAGNAAHLAGALGFSF